MPKNPWKKGGDDITSIYKAVGGSHFFGLVNYSTFEAPENYLVHVSGLLPAYERILLSMLDEPVFTDQENINSAFREEAPKMAAFHANRDSSCNVADPE